MNTKKLFTLLLFFVLISCSFIEAQTTSTGTTSFYVRLSTSTGQSAYIADNYLTSHFPNHPDLIATSWTNGGNPASARTLFQFNLSSIPSTATIVDARLSLFANPTPVNAGHSGTNASYLRRVTTHWSADSVLWEPQPDFTHNDEILLPTVTTNQNSTDIDVTNLIKDMITHPESGFGFILMQRFEYPYVSMNFASGVCADTSKRPLLKITIDSPLPVELSSFTSAINVRNVLLRWNTSSEQNNSGFEIERSALNSNSDWVKTGFVNGAGNSKGPNSYSYEDRNLLSGRYSYRLKQIDYNGNLRYYDLSNEVKIGVPDKFSLSQNYPNPFNPSTKIDFDIPQSANVILKIYDVSGREIKTLLNEFKSAGYYSQEFNAANLSSGTYFYKLQAGESVLSKDMIVLK